MKNIISEIAEDYIRNICETMLERKTLPEMEAELLAQAKKCAARLLSEYAAAIDAEILADKRMRREEGYSVERRGDVRNVLTQIGEISYNRTYFKKASGGYEYLTDTVLGIEPRERVSSGLSLSLVNAAKDMSYSKASEHISGGKVSRQTVMSRVRCSERAVQIPEGRKVAELHIDADEAHVTLLKGKKSEVPLISVYEGIEVKGKRHSCKNVFHISEYGKKPEELWEQVLGEIEARYDLTETKIYLHGDGANWIKKG